ncbi:MAG: MMPL family transporter [Methyloprofundus sp.]|nr:MMPL family transporter [Methyloprofundus sp.]
MNHRCSISHTVISWQGQFVTQYAWFIIIAALSLTTASLLYIKDNLGVNNNSAEMLSPDLPFQQNTKRLEQHFPQDAGTIIFVVDAETPEETAIIANKLSAQLKQNTDNFSSSYIPEDNEFFRQQALLYLSVDELEDLSNNLTDAQPFIGYLAQNYHLAGLLDILTKALENKESVINHSLPKLLSSMTLAINAASLDDNKPISWQEILSSNSLSNKTRRIVIAKPIKDFNALMPAENAINAARHIVQKIESHTATAKIRMTGETALEHEELETMGKGAVLSGIGSMIAVLLILFRCLRSFKLLFATLLILVMGLILTAGFAAITIGHLNVISISFAALYIGLGVDFAIHMNLHYRDEIVNKHDNTSSIKNALHSVGFSLFLCALTTSIGFLAFAPTDYKGVSELGLISGVSMFIALFLSLTVLPAFLSVLKLKKAQAIQQNTTPSALHTLPLRHKKTIRIVSLLLGFGCLFFLPYLSFDSNPVNMRNAEAISVSTFKDLLQSKTESPYALYALTDNLDKTRTTTQQLKQLNTVHNTLTLEDLVAQEQEEKLFLIEDLAIILGAQLNQFNQTLNPSDTRSVLNKFQRTLQKQLAKTAPAIEPEQLNQLNNSITQFLTEFEKNPQLAQQLDNNLLSLLPHTIDSLNQSLAAYEFNLSDIPQEIREQWLSPAGLYRIMIMPEEDLNIPSNLKQFAKDVQTIVPTATGLPVADLASGEAVVSAFQQAFSASFVLITILLLFILKSIKRTLLVIGPLVLAGLLTCSVNVLLDIPFNFANIIALPLLLGIGVDSGIHIMHCLHNNNGQQHVLQSSTARGVMFSSLTTMSSFLSLTLIPHFGISSMGITLAVGISFTLICTLIILPAFSNKSLSL